MKKIIALALLACLSVATPSIVVQAQNTDACESRMAQTLGQGEFVKKRYSINGQWSLSKDCTSQTLSFTDDFRTKGGPDLKVYLSKLPLSELDGKTVDPNSLKLSVLKSNKGAQSYSISQDINLSEYKSVVIHCEAFSVLWGGFDLPN